MAEKKEPKSRHSWREGIPEEAYTHARAARAEMRESFSALFPPEFIEHRRTARKEMLLAAQALITHAIEKIEAKDKD